METSTWVGDDERPNASDILKDHAAYDVPTEVIEDALAKDLDATIWKPGGEVTAGTGLGSTKQPVD